VRGGCDILSLILQLSLSRCTDIPRAEPDAFFAQTDRRPSLALAHDPGKGLSQRRLHVREFRFVSSVRGRNLG
jgi:hypothetical protein